MDDAWRFRSIPDHQSCPVCCVPHYPFCSPASAFFGDDRRRFPYDIRPPTFHRSFYDTSTHSPFPPLPRSPFHPPPFLLEEIRERESFPKRMRVEDPAIGAFSLCQSFNRSFSSDDERRLNLIRDHGKQDISPSQEERRQITRGYLMDRHHVEGLGSQFGSDGIDGDFSESAFGHPNGPESLFGHRNGHFQASKAYEGYRNEHIPNLEMEDRSWSNERKDFDPVELEADRRGMFNSQTADYSHASQMSRFHGSDENLDGSENFVLSAQGESSSNGSWRLASYSAIDDNALRVGSFHKQQQDQPMLGSSRLLPKQSPHPHTDSFGMVPYHRDHATQTQLESISEFYERKGEMMRASFELRPTIPDEFHKPSDAQACQAPLQLGHHTSKQAGCTSLVDKVNNVIGTYLPGKGHTSRSYSPIPPQPLFPIQTEATLSAPQVTSSVSAMVSIVSPVVADTSTKGPPSAYGSKVLPQDVLYSESPVQASDRFDEASPFICQPSLNLEERGPSFSVKYSGKERPAYVDASHLFKQPHRASRPYHIVIILRGLPGSGKSYLAKALRDIEVENGGSAPRIHAMDDYFMIEVDKVEDNEGFKSSGSVRSKKQVTKKVIEYCYEPEMEEAYRSSMLKAFKKTLDDGIFTFVIVDDRNLRVADFAQFWGIAKRSGYEVYILEATYKDPAGCAARNIHGFKLDEIQRMAKQWEDAPPLYLHLDIQSLFGGDDLDEQHIQEVDMDTDDTRDGEANHSQETDDCKSTELKLLDHLSDHGSTKLGKRWNTEEEEEEFAPVNNELQKSKWSKNLDVNCSNSSKGNTSALSGLIQAYGKGVKCVRWGDRDETIGFSIGAIKKHVSSLIIGPGAGYNPDSNPLSEDDPDGEATGKISNESKTLFNEQLRAERESFRAVFDRRRQRIVGLWDADDE